APARLLGARGGGLRGLPPALLFRYLALGQITPRHRKPRNTGTYPYSARPVGKRSLYAPRAGGAYDSHHRTAGIAGRTRRRGGGVAARGGRAAAGDDRVPR